MNLLLPRPQPPEEKIGSAAPYEQPGPGALEKLPDPGEKLGAVPGPGEQSRAAAGPGPSPLDSKPNMNGELNL